MFAGLLTSRLVFLDAVGSDPTKPRKIPGALLVRWRLCPLRRGSLWAWRGRGSWRALRSAAACRAPQCPGPGRLDAQFLLCQYASNWRPLDYAHRLLRLPPPPTPPTALVLAQSRIRCTRASTRRSRATSSRYVRARDRVLAGVGLCSRAATACRNSTVHCADISVQSCSTMRTAGRCTTTATVAATWTRTITSRYASESFSARVRICH